MPQSFRSGLRLHSEQNPQAVDFQERDFIVRATDFPTVTAAVTSASHDSVVSALPLEVPHPPDSKQRKNEFTLDMSR